MNVKKAISIIAKKDGVSRKQVLIELQKAIDEGFSNPDPAIHAEWTKIPCKGTRPTPEELIIYEVNKVRGYDSKLNHTNWNK
jgi:hypothetical protein